MPLAARSSGSSASRSAPSNVTVPPVTSYWSLPASTCASVDLPEPFGPMMAWTLPLLTERSSPLRIFFPSTSTWRFFTSNRCMSRLVMLAALTVPIIGGSDAAHAAIRGGGEIGILDAGSNRHLSRIRIINDVNLAQRRQAEVAQILRTGVDDLVWLRTGRRGNHVARAQRMGLVAEAIFARAGKNKEHLVDDMMAMEREGTLARRHHGEHAAETRRADH